MLADHSGGAAATAAERGCVAGSATVGIERRTLDGLAEATFDLAFQSVEATVGVNLALQSVDFSVLRHKGHVAVVDGILKLLDTQIGKALILIADDCAESGFELLFQNGTLLTSRVLEVEDVAFNLIHAGSSVGAVVRLEGNEIGQRAEFSTCESGSTAAATAPTTVTAKF